MLSLKDIYLKEIKADYDYDKEDDEDAFGDILPGDDELKPGEIGNSMFMDLTQHDSEVKKILNTDTGYINLPALVSTIKDEKVKEVVGPILKKWEDAIKSKAKQLIKANEGVLKLLFVIRDQSWFYKTNKDTKSKKYIFQTRKFDNKIKELDSEIQNSINSTKGVRTGNILKAYKEFYTSIMKVKKDQQLAVRIKEVIKESFKELGEEKPGLWANIRAKRAKVGKKGMAKKGSKAYKSAKKSGDKINKEVDEHYYVDATNDNEDYCPVCAAEMNEGKGKCKPSKGKRFAKRVSGKCRSFGQKGKAKKGGDRIRPGTKKGNAYCARSAKIKKCKNPPCANALSRKKWKCQGSRSVA